MSSIIDKVIGSIHDKRRWRRYKDRVRTLPPGHRTAAEALDRYLMHFAGISDGGVLVQMLEDLADLFEQGAADGTTVREIVGEDPVEFAETFAANYAEAQWITKERRRLAESIEQAERQES